MVSLRLYQRLRYSVGSSKYRKSLKIATSLVGIAHIISLIILILKTAWLMLWAFSSLWCIIAIFILFNMESVPFNLLVLKPTQKRQGCTPTIKSKNFSRYCSFSASSVIKEISSLEENIGDMRLLLSSLSMFRLSCTMFFYRKY